MNERLNDPALSSISAGRGMARPRRGRRRRATDVRDQHGHHRGHVRVVVEVVPAVVDVYLDRLALLRPFEEHGGALAAASTAGTAGPTTAV